MITSQYAYFTFEITPENCKGSDGRDEDACDAFEGIMDIANFIPETQEYQRFEDKVRQKMPEFAGLGYHMQPEDKVRGALLYTPGGTHITGTGALAAPFSGFGTSKDVQIHTFFWSIQPKK